MRTTRRETFPVAILAASLLWFLAALLLRVRNGEPVQARSHPSQESAATSAEPLPLAAEGPSSPSAKSDSQSTDASSTSGEMETVRLSAGDSDARAAGLGEGIALRPAGVFQRRGDALGYSTSSFGATLEKGRIRIAAGPARERGRAPALAYAFEEIRVGGRPLSKGGDGLATASTSTATAAYDRGGVEERYVFGENSVEQIFVVRSLPEEKGDLVVVGRITTDLVPPAEGTRASRLSFLRGTEEAMCVSEAVVVDAAGRRLPLDLAWADGRMSMTIPAAWLAEATLPIEIDPLIGSAIPLRSAIFDTGFSRACDVAWNPTDNLWLAVWTECFGSGQAYVVTGQFIRPTGVPLGTPFTISEATDQVFDVSLSYAPAPVNRFLVTWTWEIHGGRPDVTEIHGRVLSGTGSFVTAPFVIENTLGGNYTPRAAFDGANWYVAWSFQSTSTQTGSQILGRFVSSAGVTGARVDADPTVPKWAGITGVAFTGGQYVIVWSAGSAPNAAHNAYARPMTTAGVLGTTKLISAGDCLETAASNGKVLALGRLNVSPYSYWTIILDSALNATAATGVATERLCPVSSLPGWYSILPNGNLDTINAYSITEAGAVSGLMTISVPGQYCYPDGAAFSASLNEMMILYRTGPTIGSYRFEALRYSLGATLGTPAGLTGTAGAGGITLKWNPTTGATGYNVKRRTSPTGSYTTVATAVRDQTYLDATVTGGQAYLYVVTATNATTESAASNEITVTAQAVLPAPTGVFTGFGNGFINVQWGAVTGATSYNVKRSTTQGGLFNTISPPGYSNVSYTDSGLTPGSTFWYVVSAVNGAGESANSSPAVSGTAYGPVGVPTGLTATPGNAKVTLAWNVPVFVTGGYSVKRGTAPGGPFTTLVPNWAQSTYTDTTAANNTRYWYVVTAWGVTGESAPSNVANAAPMATVPPAPTGVVATPGDGKVTISWTAIPGADTYTVQQATPDSNSPYSPIASGLTSPSFVKTGLINGNSYWYIVTATDYLGTGPASAPVSAVPNIPPPIAPTGLVATPGDSSATLVWNAASGATSYIIGRSETSGGPYDTVGSSATPSFVDKDLFDGTTYYYVVIAWNAGGASPNSAQISVVPNPGPLPVLLVVGNATTLNNGDTAVRDRLVTLGYTVNLIQHDSPSLPTSATGKKLVLISSTVSSGLVLATFRDVTVPVVVWESAVMDDMMMTGGTGQFGATSTGQTQITVNAGHPLAAGLSGPITVSTSLPVTWGIPAAAAVKAAFVSGSTTQAAIYGYDTGALMVGKNAPARRVGFFMGDSTAAFLTPQGALLFEAALAWAVGGPAAPLDLVVRETDTAVYLSWTASPGATSYRVQRATSPGGPYVTIATVSGCDYQNTNLTTGSTFYYRVLAVGPQGVSSGSAEQQVTLIASGVMEIGITGTPYIKQMRQNQPFSFWNQGDYTAYVYTRTATPGVYALVPNVTSSWSLVTAPGGAFISNASTFTCTVLVSQNVANIDQIDLIRLKYTANAPGYQTKSWVVGIELRARTNVTMVFRFPQNASGGSGQTKRQWPQGQVAKFFDPDQNTRDQARTDWGNDFLNQTQQILKQSGVNLYPILDHDLLKVGGFNGSGQFETGVSGSGAWSDGVRALVKKNFGSSDDTVINVYLVEKIHDAQISSTPNGVTFPNNDDYATTIILSDPGAAVGSGGWPSTLAHETLHALGREHLKNYDQMFGLLNNLKVVIGDRSTTPSAPNYPLNWNIMREYSLGRRKDPNGDWLLPWQYDKSRQCARSFIPAFRTLD